MVSKAEIEKDLKGVHASPEDYSHTARRTSVYVYEAPLRLWHWINAAAIVVLIITGYFIGSPPPTLNAQAEAYNQFYFGYIRFAHFAAGWIVAIGFLGRIYWAIVGNHHARELFYVPFWRADYWQQVWYEIKWYAFLEKRPKKYVGHNPLAQLAMFFFMTLGLTFMILTGFAMYSEGAGLGSWPDKLFGWIIPLFGGSQNVHTYHHLGMWFIVIFMIIHIYTAIREDIMSRQSMVSSMISGNRTFKDDDPE